MNRTAVRASATTGGQKSVGGLFWRIYQVVQRVPQGRVASYGLIAHLVGPGCSARQVGYALAATPTGLDLPWQRIVNSQGRISLPGVAGEAQRVRLEAEGVRFDAGGRTDLARFGWRGVAARRPRATASRRRRG